MYSSIRLCSRATANPVMIVILILGLTIGSSIASEIQISYARPIILRDGAGRANTAAEQRPPRQRAHVEPGAKLRWMRSPLRVSSASRAFRLAPGHHLKFARRTSNGARVAVLITG